MRKQIVHFSVNQTSKVAASVYVLLFFIFVAIPGALYQMYWGGVGAGLITLIISPFIYWIVLYIMQAVLCWFYNKIAKCMGGIEFVLVDTEPVPVREEIVMTPKLTSDNKEEIL